MRCDFLVLCNKNFPNHFLEQRVSDKAGGTPQNNIQNANQEHPRRIQTTINPKTEETLVKEISLTCLFVSSELLFNVLIDSSKYLSFVGLGIHSDLFLTNGPPISSSSSSSFSLNI
jgi:hypothetical protein